MKPKNFLRSAATALALVALPVAAIAQMKVIAVQARVGGTLYGVAPNQEVVPVNVGDRVRVDLVCTSIEGGRGVERPLNARFDVAAGRGRIDIVQSGPNWAVVEVRSGGDNGAAQLGYSASGNYEMHGNLRDGRITFQIADNGRRGNGGPSRQDERWDRARDLTRLLYQGILNESPRGDERREDTERIYREGSAGVRSVALALAREAERSRPQRLGNDEAVRTLGDLYRGLLHRTQSDREMWDRDRGFRGNIETLRRDGLVRMVDVIVSSPEFRSTNRLDDLDRMPRGDRGRYGQDDRRDDRRRPPAS
jgi:hypothetical protein